MLNTKRLSVLLCALGISMGLSAREATHESGKDVTTTAASYSYKTTAADCNAAESQFDLDINNVRAKLLSGGDMWWNLSDARYEVPKIDPPGSAPSVHSLFAGAIWVSGLDEGGNLKIACQTYRQGGNDFWPGPINSGGTTDQATCKQYDRHFNVYGYEIEQARAAFQGGGSGYPTNVLKWPGKGNPYLLSTDGIYVDQNLAPFFDNDGDGLYDATKGDYPVIDGNPRCGADKVTYADQMVFWCYNDVGNLHTETGGDAIGLQVNALAFAFKTSDEINDMTFYRYNVINKSTSTLTQTYMGQWVDPDLGCYDNDFVGCDTARSMGVVYNGASTDPNCQSLGYGTEVPLLGMDFFEGPKDEFGNQLGMSSFIYYNNAGGAQGDPRTAAQFRNYMTGFWRDGNPIEYGGDGYNEGTYPFPYMFPDNPASGSGWTEGTAGNTPADRRFLQNSGPFKLLPGAQNNITIGVVWVRPPVGTYPNPDFNTTLGVADDKAQALFNNCFKILDGPDAPDLQIRELSREILINLVNASTSNNFNEGYNETDPVLAILPVSESNGDTTYRFQGYQLYQLKDATVSASELGNSAKARLVKQWDVEDSVDKLINFTFDASFGADIPELMVEGENAGIEHSIRITSDLFAEGNSQLINHKKYYYAVVAYAFNQYKDYNPLNPTGGGQKLPYLQGRKNFKVYSAIPHIIDARNNGTVLNATYGQGVAVTRISGQGNGGLELDLDSTMHEQIMADPDFSLDKLVYLPGLGPIGVSVTDPLMVKNKVYQVEFYDTIPDDSGVLSNEARWSLFDITGGNRELITKSDQSIQRKNQQLIFDTLGNSYGIALTIGQPVATYSSGYTVGATHPVFSSITGTITYTDPEKPWLSFVEDEDGNSSTNWIRSGQNRVTAQSATDENPLIEVYDDAWQSVTSGGDPLFYDPNVEFENIAGGTWAPYALAANHSCQSVTNPTSIPFSDGPGFKWFYFNANKPPEPNMDRLQSVDIVFTPDKSLWTRCVVFETGEDEALNRNQLGLKAKGGKYNNTVRNPRKGQIKPHLSMNVNGGTDVTDTGRSWFPGYAINVETGQRLNMAFGEASSLLDQNGDDMTWNPTGMLYNPLNNVMFGGKHFIYVFSSPYDECATYQRILLDNYMNYNTAPAAYDPLPVDMRTVYRDIMWTSIPYIAEGSSLKPISEGIVPDEVNVKLRVTKPYREYNTGLEVPPALNIYEFSTEGMAPSDSVAAMADSALDLIQAVPNPYYAYSEYETSQLDNRIKFTNLPNACTIRIYTLEGTLVRTLQRQVSEDISDGRSTDVINLDNTTDWDLRNEIGVPVSSGAYIIHIEAPGVGEKVIKWFGIMRPADFNAF